MDYFRRVKLWSERYVSQEITLRCRRELMFTDVGAIWVQFKISLELWMKQESAYLVFVQALVRN
jgi:hypothetical protein